MEADDELEDVDEDDEEDIEIGGDSQKKKNLKNTSPPKSKEKASNWTTQGASHALGVQLL